RQSLHQYPDGRTDQVEWRRPENVRCLAVAIEYRWGEGRSEQLVEVAAEFVQRVADDADLAIALGRLRQCLGIGEEIVPRLRRLQTCLIGNILAVNQQRRSGGMHEAELLATDIAHALNLLPDIVLADRFHDFIERVEQPLRLQGGAGDRLAV